MENQESCTDFLLQHFDRVPRAQREWHVRNDVWHVPLCATCRVRTVKWHVAGKQYRRFCSSKCAHRDPQVRSKTENTCMQKYGAKTNLSTEQNKLKVKNTCMQKYGVDNFAKTQQFKQQFQATSMQKYGVDNPAKSPEVKQRIDSSHQTRHHRKRHSQCHIPAAVIELKNNSQWITHQHHDLKKPFTVIAQELGVNHSQLCVHARHNLGIDVVRHGVSWPEQQLFEYVQQLAPDAVCSQRGIIGKKELDIVVPSANLAIEFNGVSWHSELMGKHQTYHLEKTQACAAQGLRLIHVLSTEWHHQQDLVQSRISGVLGKNTRIPARRTQVVPITRNQAKQFFDHNHIQGHANHKWCYALVHQDQIVAAMSFSKPRFNKQFDWELLRFANARYINVVGGASKLFAHFVRTHSPSNIISYCDLRWNTGGVYHAMGFDLVKQTPPAYWYIVNGSVKHRTHYQKHLLSKKLAQFHDDLTEWQNMQLNGHDRIWDCGNLVFEWHC